MNPKYLLAAVAALVACPTVKAQPAVGTAFASSRFTGSMYTVNLTTGAAAQIGAANLLGLQPSEEAHGLEFGPDAIGPGLAYFVADAAQRPKDCEGHEPIDQ